MTSPQSLARRMAIAVFRISLRRCPAAFRREYGGEMQRLFEERVQRAAGLGLFSLLKVAAGGCLDVLAGVPRARATHKPGTLFPREPVMTMVAHDVRLALKSHVRRPGFALTVILTLSISVGAVVTVMALINGAVLRPLPYPEPGRIVSIVEADSRGGSSPLSPPSLQMLRENTRAFDTIAGFSPSWSLFLAGREERVLTSVYMSDRAFDLFGVAPLQGRLFGTDEYLKRQRVAVVSQSLWRREFAEEPLGSQSISLDGIPYTVVGVISDSFKMPITASEANPTTSRAEVWLPFSLNPFFEAPNVPVMHVVARLRPDLNGPQAEQQVAVAATAFPGGPSEGRSLQVVSLAELVSNEVRRSLTLLLAGVVCLLLICAANIIGLVVARMARRAGELAMRRALGASRARLIAQLSMETGILAVLGTAGGVLIAALTLGALPALLVSGLPPSTTLAVDAPVVLGAAVLALLCTLAIGVWPALQASRSVGWASNQLTARHTAGVAARRTRKILMVAEVALAVTLLMGAGLMARSFWLMSRTDPGFTTDGLFATGVGFSEAKYPTAGHRLAFIDRALAELAGVPAVSSSAAVNRLPFSGSNVLVGLEVEGQPLEDGRPVTMDRRVATPGYFETMGLKVLEGRDFGIEDTTESTDRVAILNDAAARSLFGESHLGRRVRLALRGGPGPWLRVIGIVADVRHHGLGEPIAPEVYVPYSQSPVESMVFVVRSASDPWTLASPVRQTLKRLDPDMRVLESDQAVVGDLIQESVAEPRLRAIMVNGFAAVALLLAAIGIVSIVSVTVAQERREIGVRLALGARHRQVARRVVGHAMTLVGLGAGLGLAGGLFASRVLEGLLFGVSSTDVLTISTVLLLVSGVGFVAAYLPARRIISIEPIEILRPE